MNAKTYVLTAIISYLVSLFALTPASSVLQLIQAENDNLSFSKASGSIWKGSVGVAQFNSQEISDIYWSFTAWRLLTGELSFDVTANFLANPITANIGTSISNNLYINRLSTTIDAYTVGNLATLPVGELSGEFVIEIDSANWSPNKTPHLLGQIIWNNAGVLVIEKANLGNIIINFIESPDNPLTATISNNSGDLELDGNLFVTHNGEYSLEAKILATPTASRNLLQSLKYFARKTANRQYEVNYSGKLSQLGLQ